jgi:hypothetical protein
MTALSDTLTIGLVLVLLFGSIALYLYTRIQQAEQKITLLEHILLDLKMSAEVKTYSELPAEQSGSSSAAGASYQPFLSDDEDDDDIDVAPGATVKAYNSPSSSTRSSAASSVVVSSALEEDQQLSDKVELESYKDIIDNAIKVDADLEVEVKREVSEAKVSVNYESMTLKDLQSIAKQRGITSATTMKKAQIIEALKTSDRATSVIAEPIEPGSLSGSSSFLETSTFLGQDSD